MMRNGIRWAKHRGVTVHQSAVLLLFALIGIGVASQASLAQSNVDVAKNWGLLGTWRLDCTHPPSRSNPDQKYVVREGKLFHERGFGDMSDSHKVIAATLRPDGSLELIVDFTEFHETRQYGFVHGRSDTPRTIYNRNIDTDEFAA